MFATKPSQFYNRLEQLGVTYLPYFPRKTVNSKLIINKPLTSDELMEIIDEARSLPIQKMMVYNKDHVDQFLDGKHEAAVAS